MWIRRLGPLAIAGVAAADFFRLRTFTADARGIQLVPMAPATAVVFVLMALALSLTLFRPSIRKRSQVAVLLCGLVAVMSVQVIVSHWQGTFPAWEQWLLRAPLMIEGQNLGRMSGQGAVLALVSVFSLVALFSPAATHGMVRDAGVVSAVLVEIFAVVGAISYAAGNPPAALEGWLKVVPLTLFMFAAYNLLLLMGAQATNRLRQWFFGTEISGAQELPIPRDERVVIALLTAAGLAAVIASVIYLRVQTRHRQVQAFEAIQTIADLKARHVVQWRRERLKDARTIAGMSFLTDLVQSIAAGGADANTAKTKLESWLATLRVDATYATVVVFNRDLKPIVSQPRRAGLNAPGLREKLAALRTTSEAIELDPYLDENNILRWDLLVPLRAGGPATSLQGAIWLQGNPGRQIISQLEWWPSDYKTGQTVLWFWQDDQLHALGGVREVPGVTATQTRPFATSRTISKMPPDSVFARVLRGDTKIDEGVDHNGVPILGLGNVIRNSSWILTTRVNSSEVYASLRRDAWTMAALVVGLLGTSGVATSWLWRQRQKNLIHERLMADVEQKRTAARLGALMRLARDAMMIVDFDQKIVEVNQGAADTYGWTAAEMIGMDARDLRTTESRRHFERQSATVREPTGATYETEHRRKDGTVFPVEVSSRVVESDGRPLVFGIIRDITERKRAEAALRASEERYRLIAENTSDVIWLYDQAADSFSYASPSAYALLGFRPEEIVGQRILSFLAPESLPRATAALEELSRADPANGPKHVTIELEQKRKDGAIVPTEVVASVLRDSSGRITHVLGITRDITERRRAREVLERFNAELETKVELRTAELAARNHEVQALLDSIPDTVLLCDSGGVVLSVHAPDGTANPFHASARSATDGRAQELELIALELTREIHATARTARQSVVREFDRNVNGSMISIEARATPVGTERWLVLLRDISARKKLERDALANLERERQLSAMKSQFLSVASHEFRTPLAAAAGSVELFERHWMKISDAKRAELLTRIRGSLDRLASIMTDVLQVSRADSGRVKVQRMSADLPRLVRDIIQEVETGDRGQHQFAFHHHGSGSAVPVDTKLVHHILSNLASNAVRYSPAGTKVQVLLEVNPTGFSLTVSDEGIGIPEADREHIFAPFVRGSNVGTIGGTGLGLNIVKRYTELMGGRIELLPGDRGATFHVYVPFEQPNS